MLKKILNEAKIIFQIEAMGPILIKAGETEGETKERKKEDRNASDMIFVADANKEVYIPGSSIKGVWRGWCEKIARTISDKDSPISCDPFCEKEDSVNISCSKLIKNKGFSNVYAISCPVCKLFGNTSLGSRIRISDAYLSDKGDKTQNSLPKRYGIGIDRFTGGVCSGPFSYQYIQGRTFITEVQIRNFELWQLGLLKYLFRDFSEDLVPIGFGKTRGLGKVKGTVISMILTYYGSNKPAVDISMKKVDVIGIENLYQDNDRSFYSFDDKSAIKDIEYNEFILSPIKMTLKLNTVQSNSLFEGAAPYWAGMEGGKTNGYSVKSQSIRKDIIEKNIIKRSDA